MVRSQWPHFDFEWGSYHQFSIPHWYFIVAAVVLALLPHVTFLRVRFSLRTLLIATTLVAAALGLIAWLR
jgi:hypothetical protein